MKEQNDHEKQQKKQSNVHKVSTKKHWSTPCLSELGTDQTNGVLVNGSDSGSGKSQS
jgi:hypothetical protein